MRAPAGLFVRSFDSMSATEPDVLEDHCFLRVFTTADAQHDTIFPRLRGHEHRRRIRRRECHWALLSLTAATTTTTEAATTAATAAATTTADLLALHARAL